MAWAMGNVGALQKLGASKRFNSIGPFQEWNDPAAVTEELERLKTRQRDINMSQNPAFGGTTGGWGPLSVIGGIGPATGVANLGGKHGALLDKAKGNTNVEFYENNAKIAALEDLSGGGVGNPWRVMRTQSEAVGPGGESRQSVDARNARAAAAAEEAAAGAAEGEGPMAGQAMGALRGLSSQGGRGGGGSTLDWQARMEQEELNQARARTGVLEGATPRGQREAADAALNTEIANLRTGRTGYVAGERAKMEQGAARAKANVEAETFFDDPIAAQRRVQQEANLEAIRTGRVEPQAVAGASREEVARLQGEAQSRRVEREQFTKLLTTLLDDYTRTANNMTINVEDRQRAAEAMQNIKGFQQSLGVDLSAGTPAAGPPIR